MTPRRTTGRAVLETLKGYGIDTVFGIPGTHSLEFYRPMRELGIRAVTPRHEQGAACGADGWSLVSGLPGVVITTSGPGLLNSLSGAATAYAESRPMILLSPGRPLGQDFRDIGDLHETKDPSGAVNSIVGRSRRVTHGCEAIIMIHDAMRDFTHSRPRPVHIEIPLDILEAELDYTEHQVAPRPLGTPQPAPVDDVERAARALRQAERPVILAGGGSLAAGTDLLQLAEKLEAPVITTTNGKGAIPERHRLSLGADLRLSTAHEFLRSADALLVIGSKVGAAQDLTEVFARLDQEGRQWAPELAELNEAIMNAVPADTIIGGDSSQVTCMGSTTFFRAQQPNSLLYMGTYATLGYGLPASIGAKLAAPDRPVVCLVGDGALMFSI